MNNYADEAAYLFPEKERPVDKELWIFRAMASFYLCFNSMIPIDLAINIIMSKAMTAVIMEFDSAFVDTDKSL